MVEDITSSSSHCSSDGEVSDEESNMASTIGSTLTIKYKARNSKNSLPNNPIRNADHEHHSMLQTEACSVILKPTLVSGKSKSKRWHQRTMFLLCTIFLSVLLLGAVCIGVLFWSSPDSIWSKVSSAQASGFNFTPTDKSDGICLSRSSKEIHLNIFQLGYDITRANPIRRSGWTKPVLQESSLIECQLTSSDQCQPQVVSKMIDSMQTYQEWIADQIRTDQEEILLSTADDDYVQIQQDLISGNTIILTRISCSMKQITLKYPPIADKEFIQQLTLLSETDRETILEFFEDFGTHYVNSLSLGSQIVLKFTLNSTAAHLLTQKNISLSTQATTAGLYVLSRSNFSVHLSVKSEEIALDFMAAVSADVYPNMGIMNNERVQSALQNTVILNVHLTTLESLFQSLPSSQKLADKLHNGRQYLCWKLHARGRVSDCQNGKIPPTSFILPHISVSTNMSSVSIRAPWSHCMELCQLDPLCSAATLCAGSCSDETTCALHRNQDFINITISNLAVTSIPLREDLRPVTLRSFSIHGQPLYSTTQLTDLASCMRQCSRTWQCQIISFTNYAVDNKICRLFDSMKNNELRQEPHSTTVFIMATLGPCFPDELKQNKDICPSNADCWHGLCVCKHDYYKNGTSCMPRSSSTDDISVKKNLSAKKHKHKPATTLPPTTTSTTITTESTTESTTAMPETTITQIQVRRPDNDVKPTLGGYYIRGVLVQPKATTAATTEATSLTTTAAAAATTTTVRDTGWKTSSWLKTHSGYKPWQMRSWGSTNNSVAVVAKNQTEQTAMKATSSPWSYRGR